jgi:hypothetical protein
MAKPKTKLQPKQEAFAVNVVLNGGDKLKARADAGYSVKMTKASQGIDADKLFNHARISLRITQLQKEADKVAKETFTISVKQRLEWLSEIREAGMDTYKDQAGNERRESLTASNAAIKTMNEMLGTDEQGDGVKPVKVMIGVKDASRS